MGIEAATMSIKGIFGFGDKGDPYYVTVTYETGTIGRFDMWARDGREALTTLAKLIPTHQRIVDIQFRMRNKEGTNRDRRA